MAVLVVVAQPTVLEPSNRYTGVLGWYSGPQWHNTTTFSRQRRWLITWCRGHSPCRQRGTECPGPGSCWPWPGRRRTQGPASWCWCWCVVVHSNGCGVTDSLVWSLWNCVQYWHWAHRLVTILARVVATTVQARPWHSLCPPAILHVSCQPLPPTLSDNNIAHYWLPFLHLYYIATNINFDTKLFLQ